MKLLLTSGGITNDSIKEAFFGLVGKDPKEIKIAFVPTAANFFDGDKSWMESDIKSLKEMGLTLELVDISALPLESIRKKLENADVLFFEGGSEFFLMDWIRKSGLDELLPELLKTKVWVGISAGSMVAGQKLSLEANKLYGEDTGDYKAMKGLGLVDFDISPHLNSKDFGPGITLESASEIVDDFEGDLYVIDDQTAIQVIDDQIKVISEGQWKKYN